MVMEFFGEGVSSVRKDKPMTEREVVVVAMKHPTEDKYLCVQNRKFQWIDFVMGGIEGEESPIEAAKREVVEETGYCDFGELREVEELCYDNFYAAHKEVNRHITIHTVYGVFKSLEREERSDQEKEIAEVMWIPAGELAEKLTQKAHKYIWGLVQGEK